MRAFEFVRTDTGIPNLPVKLSSFIPGFLSDGNGPTHQAIEDISIMRGIPNMTVFAAAEFEINSAEAGIKWTLAVRVKQFHSAKQFSIASKPKKFFEHEE